MGKMKYDNAELLVRMAVDKITMASMMTRFKKISKNQRTFVSVSNAGGLFFRGVKSSSSMQQY